MIDLDVLRQAARTTVDKEGALVAQLPLTVWLDLLAQIESELSSQERIRELLSEFESHPDKASLEWADRFKEVLNEERFSMREHDLGLSDEWPT
jgi:hypothetical protein